MLTLPFIKISEDLEQHVRPVLFLSSVLLEMDGARKMGKRQTECKCGASNRKRLSGDVRVTHTSSFLWPLGNVAESCPPLLCDLVQSTVGELRFSLQVESPEETLPDGLQRLTLAPRH